MVENATAHDGGRRQTMTAGEVAAVLGVHPDTMARKIRDGVLPLKRVRWSSSKRPKYLTADVERVVRRRLYT